MTSAILHTSAAAELHKTKMNIKMKNNVLKIIARFSDNYKKVNIKFLYLSKTSTIGLDEYI